MLLSTCLTCVVLAQAAAPAVPPPATALPSYVSPFSDYRRFDAEPPAKPWRQANEEVREAGGHVGILKGMANPAPATAAKPPSGGEPRAAASTPAQKPPAKPAAPAHGSHR